MTELKIENVRTIVTAPTGQNLVIVKVDTSEPGLYGLGCATFTQRHLAVKTAVEKYLKPFLIGKNPSKIKDLWHTARVSSYWRNGPVLNNALSGVDMALWDIKGKEAGMPLYELFGGKCREGAAAYVHADGKSPEEVEKNVRKYIEEGYEHIRCQISGYGGEAPEVNPPKNSPPGNYYSPKKYFHDVLDLFDYLRGKIGYDINLLHDIHERLKPNDAIRLAKRLEPYELFFLEDLLPPEKVGWFKKIRQQSSVPIAMGELFNNPLEWKTLISDRLIDYIRVHISQIGGITPALKLAHFSDQYGVETAWHGPLDVSPVGHAANLHLDLSISNFGIQEWMDGNEALREVFPGMPKVEDGYLYLNEEPGLGVDIDEEAASKYPCSAELPEWTQTRKPDGSSTVP